MSSATKRQLSSFYFFAYGASGALFPILPLVWTVRGLTPSQIAWAAIVNSLAGVLVPPLWGYIADRFHVREMLLRIVGIGAALTVLLLILPHTLAETVLAMAVFCFFRSAIASLIDATTYASLGADRSRFGLVRVWGSLSFAIGASLAGVFTASQHSNALFICCAILYALSAFVAPRASAAPAVKTASRQIGHAFAETMKSGLGWMLLANIFYYAAHSVFDIFFTLYVRKIGHSELYGSVGWGIAVLAEVAVMLRAPTIIASRSSSKLLVFCAAVATSRWIALAIVREPSMVLALNLLHGITFGLWYLAIVAHVQAKVPEDVRTSVQAVLLGSLAIGSVLGTYIGGTVLEQFGGGSMFAVAGMMSAVGFALYSEKKHRTRLFVAAAAVVAIALLAPSIFPGAILRGAMYAERSLSHLEEKQVTVAGKLNIVYLEGGPKDAPVLLLLHGFGGDKDNWTRMARELTGEYRVIAPDLPGFGRSSAFGDESYDIASQARRLDAFVQALSLPPHHVAGNSMGGNLAGAYAVMFPANIKSVAFFANSGIKSPKDSELTVRRARGEQPLLVDTPEQYDALMNLIFVKRPWIPGPVLDHFAREAIRHRAFNAKVWRDLDTRPYPLEPVLANIAAPVLIVWGDHDRLLDVSSIEVMRPLLPQAKVVILKDVGHVPMIEVPEESAIAYLAFLRDPSSGSSPTAQTD